MSSKLDPAFLRQLNQNFDQDMRQLFSRLSFQLEIEEMNSIVHLDFDSIPKGTMKTLHNLCLKHQRAYEIIPRDNHTIRFTVFPPENWR